MIHCRMCNVILRASICNFSNIHAFNVLIIRKLQLAIVPHATVITMAEAEAKGSQFLRPARVT